jgi:hypothetical protein
MSRKIDPKKIDEVFADFELPTDEAIFEQTRRVKISISQVGLPHSEQRKSSIKQAKLESGETILTDEIRKEIFYNSWGEDRGGKYIREIAKKYGVKPATVKDWTGQSAAKHFGEDYKVLQQEWKSKYDPPYILRSPGNDLLDYYDEINKLRHKNNKLLLPPSVIYHYKFIEPNWTTAEVKAKFPHIKPNTLYPLLRHRVEWLIDQPHTEYKFENRQQMVEWCQKKFGNGAAIREIADPHKGTAGMAWKGAMAGWSIIKG